MTLTKRQREILTIMRDRQDDDEDFDGEIVREGRVAYLGYQRVSVRTINELVVLCAISLDQHSTVGRCERYHINETGRRLLDGTMEYPKELAEFITRSLANQ